MSNRASRRKRSGINDVPKTAALHQPSPQGTGSSPNGVDKSKLFWIWIMRLLLSGFVAFLLLMLSTPKNGGFAAIAPEDMPSFVAPAVTLFVAWMALSKYLVDTWYIAGVLKVKLPNLFAVVTILCAFSIGLPCYFLTSQHGWQGHLIWMFVLFVLFLVWDISVLHLTASVDNAYFIEERGHIKNGSVLINWPSIIAIIFLFTVLKMNWMFPEDWILWSPLGSARKPPDELTPKDVFVSGIISFHLFVAALGYLFGAVAKEKKRRKLQLDF